MDIISQTGRCIQMNFLSQINIVIQDILNTIVRLICVGNSQYAFIISTNSQCHTIPTITVINRNATTGTKIIREMFIYLPKQISTCIELLIVYDVIIVILPTIHICLRIHIIQQRRVIRRSAIGSSIQHRTCQRASNASGCITTGHHIILL